MSCLAVVVDCDACHWGELVEKEHDEGVVGTLIDAVVSYATAHLSLAASNRVAIVGVDSALEKPTIFATHTSTNVCLRHCSFANFNYHKFH
ncbi:unnamed protein product [Gongylonema pulchrum]|uniref:General transcription factor IIH subunit 3 n=1 Tax=Gongylonema pulchrum TaxID=637853 RepID=A0A183EMB5_9BILA|nr:unnamed protein product [Gongylonema pulchrum]